MEAIEKLGIQNLERLRRVMMTSCGLSFSSPFRWYMGQLGNAPPKPGEQAARSSSVNGPRAKEQESHERFST